MSLSLPVSLGADDLAPYQGRVDGLDLAEALGHVVLVSGFLSRLRSDEIRTVAESSRRRRLAVGRLIRNVWGTPNKFRLVLAGRLLLEPSYPTLGARSVVEAVEAGGFIGESGFAADGELDMRARVVGAVDMLEMSNDALWPALRRDPRLRAMLSQSSEQRATKLGLARCTLFPELHPQARSLIADNGSIAGVERGQHLIRIGTKSASLFVVLRGRLEARVPGTGAVYPRLPGDLVGEMSTYGDGELFDVVATESTRVLKISRRVFAELISTHPMVLERLSALVDERVRSTRVMPQLEVRRKTRAT